MFQEFKKIPRLTRDCIITEKIDGTNAQVEIVTYDTVEDPSRVIAIGPYRPFEPRIVMLAGSRNRYITPEDDNYGFAKWVKEHAEELFALGPGRHYGEWWGGKIQRGYGLTEKRFSLFNVSRWADRLMNGLVYMGDDQVGPLPKEGQQWAPACCRVVPVLYEGLFSTEAVGTQVERLRTLGSVAAPGFLDPEGVCVYHVAAGIYFKKTVKGDASWKGKVA